MNGGAILLVAARAGRYRCSEPCRIVIIVAVVVVVVVVVGVVAARLGRCACGRCRDWGAQSVGAEGKVHGF